MAKYIVYQTKENLIGGFKEASKDERPNAPEGFKPENYKDWLKEDGEWVFDPVRANRLRLNRGFTTTQSKKADEIRREALSKIKETEEDLEEAKEREDLGLSEDGPKVKDVLANREAIRRAKNRSIREMSRMSDEEAANYKFRIKPEDRKPPKKVSKLSFLRRFTREERMLLRQKESEDSMIADFQELLYNASSVTVTDPDIVEFFDYAVSEGYISRDRADQILLKY